MSRNFELLRRAKRDHEVLAPEATTPPRASSPPLHASAASLEKELSELLARVAQGPGGEKRGSILFAAVEPGAGTTWICAMLGRMLATSTTRPVCLVDANLRAPALHGYFGVDVHPGLSDALSSPDRPITDFIRAIEGTCVSIVPAGTRLRKPPQFAPANFAVRLAQLRVRFDLVLIDAPAASAYPDAFSLSEHVDGVALVLSANSTHREVARKVKEGFEDGSKAPVIGAVLNQRAYPIPDVLYRVL